MLEISHSAEKWEFPTTMTKYILSSEQEEKGKRWIMRDTLKKGGKKKIRIMPDINACKEDTKDYQKIVFSAEAFGKSYKRCQFK